jgi:hypothetical protein
MMTRMSAWQRLFTEHPATVNEDYWQHFASAAGFGFRMIWGGLICLVHAFVPGVCCTKASEMISELHDRMVTNRRRPAKPAELMETRRAA